MISLRISSMSVVNIYKPPSIKWSEPNMTNFVHPCVFMGDFNSHHVNWGYNNNDHDGVFLKDWMHNNGFNLIFDAKAKKSFFSKVHGTETNPDLCFVSDSIYQTGSAKIIVLNDFPRSQHRPIVLKLGMTIHLVHSLDKPRWNFQKAKWSEFSMEMDHVIQFIPPKVDNYEKFIKLTKSIAKKHVPRGVRQTYIPGWNKN